jgi:endoglucanase
LNALLPKTLSAHSPLKERRETVTAKLVLLLVLTALPVTGALAAEALKVEHVGTVSPDVIGITVSTGHVEYGRQVPYERRPGDGVSTGDQNRWLLRDGKAIGALVGPREGILWTPDRLVTSPLDTAKAARTESYRIASSDDPAYGKGLSPAAVHRKSKPTDFARVAPWTFEAPVRHVLYLKLPRPLTEGAHYTITCPGGMLPEQSLVYESAHLRSEAVHVNQLGFRPDDPVKLAFLSCWMGDGGGCGYAEGVEFYVLDDATGRRAFEGVTKLSKAAADATEDAYNRNYNAADVYEMDFSALRAPGTYRVCVQGVGCSYPFRIDADVWRDAFRVSARGFYHQRSGIPLGPPYTDFVRPRPFHPDDGVKVYASTTPLMDTGDGINAKGTDADNFGNLVKGKTDRLVPDAWGGYMDAGDWDRRIQHLIAADYLLELVEQFPDYYGGFGLNIPESGNGLPDLVNEALFGLDCYRRMQTPEGGIRGGIESSEHPRQGEGSWQESLTIMAYAPGMWSSWLYAASAANAALVLQQRAPELAATYRASALRAAEWAEAQWQKRKDEKFPHAVNDARNYAAAALFRLTGEPRWHEIFAATTALNVPDPQLSVWQDHEQSQAAWTYLNTDRPGMDAHLKDCCRRALLREADERLAMVGRTAFHWTKNQWAPTSWSALSAPDAVSLVRAHFITGEPKYLRAAVLACQEAAGANPVNICYTTGLGQDWPRHPLHVDSRISRQEPPPGLTVFGPADTKGSDQKWAQDLVDRSCYPALKEWPTVEAYWDVFWYPVVCEFTVQQPMARNAYVWGYLAARP